MKDLSKLRSHGFDITFERPSTNDVVLKPDGTPLVLPRSAVVASYSGNRVLFYQRTDDEQLRTVYLRRNRAPVPGQVWQDIKAHVNFITALQKSHIVRVYLNRNPRHSPRRATLSAVIS